MRSHSISLALLLFGSLATSGCSSQLQQLSAGYVGCPPKEIAIANKTLISWQATCRGREFQCSAAGNTVHCTELLSPAPTPPASAPAAAPPAQ